MTEFPLDNPPAVPAAPSSSMDSTFVEEDNAKVQELLDTHFLSREELEQGLTEFDFYDPSYSELPGLVQMRILLTPGVQYLLDHAKGAPELFAFIAETCSHLEETQLHISIQGNKVLFKTKDDVEIMTRELPEPFIVDFDLEFGNLIMNLSTEE